jgi:hypothetical protein
MGDLMDSDRQPDGPASTATTPSSLPSSGSLIGNLFRLAFVAVASVMAGYWLLKPYVNFDAWFEAAYVKECKALVSQSDGVRNFRVDFQKIESGETYKVGDPGRTTGFYTTLRMIYGQGREVVQCHADIGKQFTKAEITLPGIGCIRHFPSGQREIRPAC